MQEIGINLFRTQQSLTPYELANLYRIKTVSIAALVCCIAVGVLLGGIFLFVKQQISSLERERTVVTRRLTLASRKEVLLLSLKDRIPATQRTLNSQYSWSSILSTITSLASPPVLTGFRIDDKNNFIVDIVSPSLREMSSLVETLYQFSEDERIKQPIINSLQIGEDGFITTSIQFQPGK